MYINRKLIKSMIKDSKKIFLASLCGKFVCLAHYIYIVGSFFTVSCHHCFDKLKQFPLGILSMHDSINRTFISIVTKNNDIIKHCNNLEIVCGSRYNLCRLRKLCDKTI